MSDGPFRNFHSEWGKVHVIGVTLQGAMCFWADWVLAVTDRIEAPVAVPRHLDFHRALLGLQGLAARAVSGIRGAAAPLVLSLVPQALRHLGLHRPLHRPGRQLLQDAVLARQVLRLGVFASSWSQGSSEKGTGLRCHRRHGLSSGQEPTATFALTQFFGHPRPVPRPPHP